MPDAEHRCVFPTLEVIIALTLAGLVKMALATLASGAFHVGHSDVGEIEQASHTLTLPGAGAAGVFPTRLRRFEFSRRDDGGTDDHAGFRIPAWLRRIATMVPALVVEAFGVNATDAPVYSQVVLSFALQVPMIALVVLTCQRDIMGLVVNSWLVSVAAIPGTC
jgi:manganese transport protein